MSILDLGKKPEQLAPKEPPVPPQQGEKQKGEEKNPNARVLGLDVAKYQDKLDPSEWARLYQMGYRFAFIKATDGITGKDPYYEIHRKNAKAAGFLIGAYHFLRFGYSASLQAKHLFETAKRVPGELPLVLDCEWDRYTTGLNGKSYGEGKRMDSWAEDHAYEFVNTLTLIGNKKPIVYTNAYFWPERVRLPWDQFLLWVPSYADSLNPGGVHHLKDLSPAEIAKAGAGVKIPAGWKDWTIWQDEDDLAIGDVKAIDTNVFKGSLEDLKRLCN